jgi:hypothetical protein
MEKAGAGEATLVAEPGGKSIAPAALAALVARPTPILSPKGNLRDNWEKYWDRASQTGAAQAFSPLTP